MGRRTSIGTTRSSEKKRKKKKGKKRGNVYVMESGIGKQDTLLQILQMLQHTTMQDDVINHVVLVLSLVQTERAAEVLLMSRL